MYACMEPNSFGGEFGDLVWNVTNQINKSLHTPYITSASCLSDCQSVGRADGRTVVEREASASLGCLYMYAWV